MDNEKAKFTWFGKPNNELTREELLNVIEHLMGEVERERKKEKAGVE